MKKIGYSLGLVVCAVMLGACQVQQQNNVEKSSNTNQSTASTTSSVQESSSSSSPLESQKRESETQASDAQVATSEQLYASTLEKVAADRTPEHATYYVFYDVDHNGTDELITGRVYEGQTDIYPAALYYIDHGVSTYLAESRVASAGGYRSQFALNEDGTVFAVRWFSGSGAGEASLYEFTEDNTGVTILKQESFDMSKGQKMPNYQTEHTVDMKSLEWKAFD